MGLYISRKIIEMEAQPPNPDDIEAQEEIEVFHKSKFLRWLLGIGIVLQACTGAFCLVAAILEGPGFYNNGIFIEILRFLGAVYIIAFLWNSTIWFLCIYYNKTLPRNKIFIITELSRTIPWMLTAVVFMVGAVPEIIRELRWNWTYNHPIGALILAITAATTLWAFALWSLVYLFIYFITQRKEEIIKTLKIGQKKEAEGEQPAAAQNVVEGGVAERSRVANGNDSEDASLLIEHDEIV